ncbi:MAG: Uma2 family endonuclease [Thermostichales cyanobacterium DRC_bins_46]
MVQVSARPSVRWDPLPADFVLPDEPVDNLLQPALAAALTEALGANGLIRPEMLIATNMALVATVDNQLVVKAPDWFYVPQVYPLLQGSVRRSYTPYREGVGVAVVMEFLSDTDGGELSMRSTPPLGKLYFYEQILQVPTYVTYDPYSEQLQVRQLGDDGAYHLQEANPQGRFGVPALNLELGLWQGERLGLQTTWLRWWNPSGQMLLWSSEQAEWSSEQAEQERQRAERLAAKLRELGLDPNTLG